MSLTRAHHQKGGAYLLYKGRAARIQEELAEARLDRGVRLIRLERVGEAEERHLVAIDVPEPS